MALSLLLGCSPFSSKTLWFVNFHLAEQACHFKKPPKLPFERAHPTLTGNRNKKMISGSRARRQEVSCTGCLCGNLKGAQNAGLFEQVASN